MTEPRGPKGKAQPPAAMRVDKWLWHARFFKTRTLATKLAAAGNIRINGQKQSRAAANVRAGDVLTFPLNNHIRVIEILALSTRRGPAPEAQALYNDQAPPQPKPKSEKPAFRDAGAGRPTKKQRRTQDAFTGRGLPGK